MRGGWQCPEAAGRRSDARVRAAGLPRGKVAAIAAMLCLGIFDGTRAVAQRPPPTILSLAPTAGHAVGGYPVAVSGRGFAADDGGRFTCRFSCSPTGACPHRG